MAAATARTLPRLVTTLRTTPTLRTPAARAISSFEGLRNLAQPGRVPVEEVEATNFMSVHLDSLSFWHDESEKMRNGREMPPSHDIHVALREQTVELLEELVEEKILDVRTGWLKESHR